MRYAKLAVYVAGLLLVVAGAWVFLTRTPIADGIPTDIALAIVLLLLGVGAMIVANAMDDARSRRVDSRPVLRRPPQGGEPR